MHKEQYNENSLYSGNTECNNVIQNPKIVEGNPYGYPSKYEQRPKNEAIESWSRMSISSVCMFHRYHPTCA